MYPFSLGDFPRWARNTLRFYNLWLGAHHDDFRILKSGHPPVILLCGWGATPHTMALLEKRLARDGFAPVVFPLKGIFGKFNTRGVDDSARYLGRHLDALRKALALPRVAIVGHSLGGLIGRALVSIEGGDRFVHTLVTLGTPHRGSPLAKAARYTPLRWMSKGLRQATPGSRLLELLRVKPPPASVSCAALFSPADAYCPPPHAEFEIPPGAVHIANRDVGFIGHVEMVIDEGVYRIVREELLTGLARAGLAAPVIGSPSAVSKR